MAGYRQRQADKRERENLGSKRHRASFQEHDGTVDTSGNPTLGTPGDWDEVITDWPCEFVTQDGSEPIQGNQVAEETTHILFGEYWGASTATADMQCVLNGITYEVLAVLDLSGDSRELRIDLKRENFL